MIRTLAAFALSAALAATSLGAKATVAVDEQWAQAKSTQFTNTSRGGGTARSGVADGGALDGRALRLTIPAGVGAGTEHAAEMTSRSTVSSGTFTARLRTADCSAQPDTGAVTGLFTYGNDGSDADGDGIVDNSELDVEVLCARPNELNLTIWTDYDDAGPQRRVSRTVDVAAGTVGRTCFFTDWDTCRPVSAAESQPAAVTPVPGFDSSAAYVTYRITWRRDRVVFSLVVDGSEIVLWDYRGRRSRIPARPSTLRVNLWHTPDWAPESAPQATKSPSAPLSVWVDQLTIAR